MILKRTLVAGAFVAVSGLAANAADIPMAPAPAAPPAPCVCEEGADWGGLYIGVLGDMQFVSTGGTYSPWIGIGARVGYNFDFGNFVAGVEGTVEYSTTLPGPWAQYTAVEAVAVARAGVEVAGGKGLIFAAAGGGSLWNLTNDQQAYFWTVGGGLEVMATDRLSIRTDYRYQGFPGFPPGFNSHNFSVGLNFHLGN